MPYTVRRGALSRTYADLRTLLATASAKKSGDELAGIAAESDEERALARLCLADVPLRAFLEDLVVPCETDEVTRLVIDGHDPARFEPVSGMTVGEFRELLLAPTTTTESLAHLASGVTHAIRPSVVSASC